VLTYILLDFGYLDGISNPAVEGFQSPLPGQAVVPTGEILVGENGDAGIDNRPSWAKDGSFLVFRQLQQLVPEFNKFLTDNPIRAPALTPKQGSELLGARMIGRWKSVSCYYNIFPANTADCMDREHRSSWLLWWTIRLSEQIQPVTTTLRMERPARRPERRTRQTNPSKSYSGFDLNAVLTCFAKVPLLCAHSEDTAACRFRAP
jgi:hypothetical protein